METYLSQIEDNQKRILLTKLRIGVCPLRIETGRYEGGNKRIPPEERLYLCCNMACVEDEIHFLMQCPMYEYNRSILFGIVRQELLVTELTANIKDLFIIIMTSKSVNIIRALSDFIWEAFQLREALVSCKNKGDPSIENVIVYIEDE